MDKNSMEKKPNLKIEKILALNSAKKILELSSFLSREMLYDFVTRRLSNDDQRKIEEKIRSSTEIAGELKKLQDARDYLRSLSHFEVPANILSKIEGLETKGILSTNDESLNSVPDGMRQALVALGIVTLVLVLVISIPWQKVKDLQIFKSSNQMVVASVDKNKASQDLQLIEKNENPEFLDETSTKDEMRTGFENKKELATKPSPMVEVTPAPLVSKTTAQPDLAKSTVPVSQQGYIYRGQLKMTNLEANGQRLKEKIFELGGRKAGEVELGWKRNGNTLYYHFTIPEAKYKELNEFLGLYGKTKIMKERHPRVMPEGIIRLVLTVDEEKK